MDLSGQFASGQLTGAAQAAAVPAAQYVLPANLARFTGYATPARPAVRSRLLLRHLREDALAMLGGGTAAFMRLGHHAEAEQAASYIGRQHKSVLSQLTATVGGNQTFTGSDTDGDSDGDSSSRSRQEFHLGFGTRTRGTSTSRNWSTGRSWADGTSWSEATTTTQRVYEYAVEPAVLQNLPDHALLLTVRHPHGPRLQAVECDPAIATLPGLSPPLPAQRPVPARSGDPQLPPVPPRWPESPRWQPEPAHLPAPPGPRRPPGRHRA